MKRDYIKVWTVFVVSAIVIVIALVVEVGVEVIVAIVTVEEIAL